VTAFSLFSKEDYLESLGQVVGNVAPDSQLPDTNVHAPSVKLIRCAYPHGIPHAHYMTLLSILAKEMSIRVLPSVIAHVRGGHYSIYMNDVIESMHYTPTDEEFAIVMEKLIACGYEVWLKD
jgi:hypothetical protein